MLNSAVSSAQHQITLRTAHDLTMLNSAVSSVQHQITLKTAHIQEHVLPPYDLSMLYFAMIFSWTILQELLP
jgi:hypothetical protein